MSKTKENIGSAIPGRRGRPAKNIVKATRNVSKKATVDEVPVVASVVVSSAEA